MAGIIDVQGLQTLINLLATTDTSNEPKNPRVRFVESIKLKEYIDKSCRGWILNINESTKRQLQLEEKKSQLYSSTKPEEVDSIVKQLNNPAVNIANASDVIGSSFGSKRETYPIGTVIQIVTRLMAYSLQFTRCLASTPNERLASAVVAMADYRRAQLDLSNPFTTVEWRVLISEFLEKAQTALQVNVNPCVHELTVFMYFVCFKVTDTLNTTLHIYRFSEATEDLKT